MRHGQGPLLVASTVVTVMAAIVDGIQWNTVFEDEFDGAAGTSPSSATWKFENGYQRNGELQFYTSRLKNANLSGESTLLLTAHHETMDGDPYTSASIYTDKVLLQFGRISMRAKVPAGPGQKGTWPAFWMLGQNYEPEGWPQCGEIDVMEAVGYDTNMAHAALHTTASHEANAAPHGETILSDIAGTWHTYSAEWTPEKITFWVDAIQILTFANDGECNPATWPFRQPFNLKLNLAVGGSWGGKYGVNSAAFPVVFEIDYVRWEQPVGLDTSDPSTYPGISPGQFVCRDTQMYAVLTPADENSAAITRDLVLASAAFTNDTEQDLILSQFKAAVVSIVQDAGPNTVQILGGLSLLLPPEGGEGGSSRPYVVLNFTVNDAHPPTDATLALALSNMADATVATPGIPASLVTALTTLQSSTTTGSIPWRFVNLSTSCWAPLCVVDSNTRRVPQPVPFETFTLPVAVLATSFDFGGSGVGFSDTTDENKYDHSMLRPGGPDINQNDDGEYFIGYTKSSEWQRYSGIILTHATDRIEVQVSAANGASSGETGQLQLKLCGPWVADAGTDVLRCPDVWTTQINIPPTASGHEVFTLHSPNGGQPTSSQSILHAGRYQLLVNVVSDPMTLHTIRLAPGNDQMYAVLTPADENSAAITRDSVLASAAFTNDTQQDLILSQFKAAVASIVQGTGPNTVQILGGLSLLLPPEGGEDGSSRPYVVLNFTVDTHPPTDATLALALSNMADATVATPGIPASLVTALTTLQSTTTSGSIPWRFVNLSTSCWAPLCVVDSNTRRVPQPVPFETFTLPVTVLATSFDFGGSGVGYFDRTDGNDYGFSMHRSGPDIPDIHQNDDGEYYIGYAQSSEWQRYSGITLTHATDRIEVHVSAANAASSGETGQLQLKLCGPWVADAGTDALRCPDVWTTQINIPTTNSGWEVFTLHSPNGGQPTSSQSIVHAGRYQLLVTVVSGPMTFHGVVLAAGDVLTPAPTTATPMTPEPTPVPTLAPTSESTTAPTAPTEPTPAPSTSAASTTPETAEPSPGPTDKATQTPVPLSDYCKHLTTASACTTKPLDKNCLWVGSRCVAKQAPKVHAPVATTASGASVPTTVSAAPVATSSAAGSVGSAINSGNTGNSASMFTSTGSTSGGDSGTATLATFVALLLIVALD